MKNDVGTRGIELSVSNKLIFELTLFYQLLDSDFDMAYTLKPSNSALFRIKPGTLRFHVQYGKHSCFVGGGKTYIEFRLKEH